MSKRVLCGLALAAAAFAATPAQAAPDLPVKVTVTDDYISVTSGIAGQPLVNVHVNRDTAEVCVGFSHQVPFCVLVEPID